MVRALAVLAVLVSLTGCGTTHPLPPYETPLVRTQFQSVRTTAYTHTESDHVEYGNHNALGGTLHAAAPARVLASDVASPRTYEGGFQPVVNTQPLTQPPAIPVNGLGSAAADWSRWPAGTCFGSLRRGRCIRWTIMAGRWRVATPSTFTSRPVPR